MNSTDIDQLLHRLNTTTLANGNPAATRALVVVNRENASVSASIVHFRASFPVRASVGAQPVTVRDEHGEVVPSRLTESTLTPSADLPPDRRLWTMTLEFVVANVPAKGWLAYAATFGASPDSRESDTAFWADLPMTDLPIYETDCHDGDLPLRGTFDATVPAPTA